MIPSARRPYKGCRKKPMRYFVRAAIGPQILAIAAAAWVLGGCAPRPASLVSTRPAVETARPVTTPATRAATPDPTEQDASRLARCTRELEALKQFNPTRYAGYHRELEQITRTGAQYLAVSAGISQDINDLVQPRYQYALTSLCQRVRADLSAALINQVAIK